LIIIAGKSASLVGELRFHLLIRVRKLHVRKARSVPARDGIFRGFEMGVRP
jgi:hypothetical protein